MSEWAIGERDFILTEYDEADTMRRLKKHYTEIALAKGREEGLEAGREEEAAAQREANLARAATSVERGMLSLEDASALFGFSREEIEARL